MRPGGLAPPIDARRLAGQPRLVSARAARSRAYVWTVRRGQCSSARSDLVEAHEAGADDLDSRRVLQCRRCRGGRRDERAHTSSKRIDELQNPLG